MGRGGLAKRSIETHRKVIRISSDSRIPHLCKLGPLSDVTLVEKHGRDVDVQDEVAAEESGEASVSGVASGTRQPVRG